MHLGDENNSVGLDPETNRLEDAEAVTPGFEGPGRADVSLSWETAGSGGGEEVDASTGHEAPQGPGLAPPSSPDFLQVPHPPLVPPPRCAHCF